LRYIIKNDSKTIAEATEKKNRRTHGYRELSTIIVYALCTGELFRSVRAEARVVFCAIP
jgi:hypothetical protein